MDDDDEWRMTTPADTVHNIRQNTINNYLETNLQFDENAKKTNVNKLWFVGTAGKINLPPRYQSSLTWVFLASFLVILCNFL